MRTLVNALARSGLLKEDLEYHLLRASMVIIFLFFGYQKWFEYEALVLIPYISAMARFFSGCTRCLASVEPVGFWDFQNGCSLSSCFSGSGTRDSESWGPSDQLSRL